MSRYKLLDGTPAVRTSNVLDLIPKDLKGWASGVGLEMAYDHVTRKGRPFIRSNIKDFKYSYKRQNERACDIGTLAHAYIESYISGKLSVPDMSNMDKLEADLRKNHGDDCVEIALACYKSFIDFDSNVQPQYIETEMMAVSEDYRYGGTVDCLAIIDGKEVVLDWKTSNRMYEQYDLQLAAYWNLAREVCKFDADEAWILRFDKVNHDFYEPRYLLRNQLEGDFEIFKDLIKAYYSLEQRGLLND